MYKKAFHAATMIKMQAERGTPYAKYMLGVLLHRLRSSRELFGVDQWWPVEMDTDAFRSTLMLIGNVGMGTRIHVDWTEAINLALGIASRWDDKMAVALWMFVRPNAMRELDTLLKQWASAPDKGGLSATFPLGLCTPNMPIFTEADMRRMKGHMGDKVMLVEQRAGQVVRAMAGWGHAVVNLQPCIKIAYDMFVVDNFPSYAIAHAMTARLFKNNCIHDYTSWAKVISSCMSG